LGVTTGQIDPRYGDPSATAPPWGDIEGLLRRAQLYWIITVRVDGRPHAVPLVGVWHAGAFAFCTGPAEQKHLNLDANAQVAVTTRKHRRQRVDQRPGCRGRGHGSAGDRRRGPALVMSATLADAWFAKYGDDWRFEVQGREFVELSDTAGSTHEPTLPRKAAKIGQTRPSRCARGPRVPRPTCTKGRA
jgi:hypothetical protein